jgi:preprotein translocase subunit YajC
MNSAYAMGLPGGGGGGGAAGGDFSFIIMMAVLFGIFYFLMIR